MRPGLILLLAGGSAVTALVAWFGAAAIGHEVWQAGWAIPPILVLHGVQLHLSAVAWRMAVGRREPHVGRYLYIRWLREAVNSMLPVAQLGGNVVGVRLLMQRGVPGTVAAAGTTIDLTIEAVTQLLFTLGGVAVLAAVRQDQAWAAWVEGGLVATGIGLAGFVAVQRLGFVRLVEWLALWLRRFFPGFSVDAVRRLHAELLRLQRNRGMLLRATLLHLLAWVLGVAETWLALVAMGRPTGLAEAVVIESLGMAARSAGFVVPGALGVQEAGFILVGGLFGVAPDQAIALSMVKRLRELAVGVPGLLAWQWGEGRRMLRRRGD